MYIIVATVSEHIHVFREQKGLSEFWLHGRWAFDACQTPRKLQRTVERNIEVLEFFSNLTELNITSENHEIIMLFKYFLLSGDGLVLATYLWRNILKNDGTPKKWIPVFIADLGRIKKPESDYQIVWYPLVNCALKTTGKDGEN